MMAFGGSSKETPDNKLRQHGYMTPDEFIDALTPGLKEYMISNWGRNGQLMHPEDLATTASIYMEVAYRVIADMYTAWRNQYDN
jgi:hypothetical protein